MRHLTLLAALVLMSNPAQAALPIGKVIAVTGKAWAAEGSLKKRELKEGAPIFAADLLTTDKGGDVTLKLGDDAAVKLKNEAEVTFDKTGTKNWALNLRKGGILSFVANPLKKPDIFRIRTRSAVMGVRGTVFYVQDGAEDTFLCTCAGTVAVRAGGKETALTSKHHDAPKHIAADGTFTEAPMGADHSDEEAAALVKAFAPVK